MEGEPDKYLKPRSDTPLSSPPPATLESIEQLPLATRGKLHLAFRMSLTILQKTNSTGWPKAGELIEMSGTHPLEASDRAILNTLYQFAHDAGNMGELGAKWEIPLTKLRFSAHQSNDKLYQSLQRLRKVEVTIRYIDDGEKRIILTGLFDFFDISAKELERRATLRFGLPTMLAPLLARSDRWGRIKAEVVCSMSSRYAISLYEAVRLRANLDRCIEVIPIDKFRDMLSVPPGAYVNGANFAAKVLEPAVTECNGLSDISVKIELKRRHLRAPIESVVMVWWKKDAEELAAVIRELGKSTLGRMERLKGAGL